MFKVPLISLTPKKIFLNMRDRGLPWMLEYAPLFYHSVSRPDRYRFTATIAEVTVRWQNKNSGRPGLCFSGPSAPPFHKFRLNIPMPPTNTNINPYFVGGDFTRFL